MYTRCPSCEALYALSPEELAEAAGVVRCSNCGKTFNSLAQLFARTPEPADSPLRGQGMPPLLSQRILVQPSLPGFDDEATKSRSDQHTAGPTRAASEASAEAEGSEPQRSASGSLRWALAATVLGLIALAQTLTLLEWPDGWVDGGGTATPAPSPGSAIALVGRDLHAHPSRKDAVVISALLRNHSSSTVEFPLLELRLFDRSNQLLGVRRLPPHEYLFDTARAPNGLSAGSTLPVIVEVAVTGSEPTGFEIRLL